MPHVVGIDHLAIRVRDFARSKAFYDRLLGYLGFTLEWEFDHVAGWDNGGALTSIQVIINPLVSLMWTGGIVLAIGGIFCILPRLLPNSRPLPLPAAAPVYEKLGSNGRGKKHGQRRAIAVGRTN